jgi:hypothetical protein
MRRAATTVARSVAMDLAVATSAVKFRAALMAPTARNMDARVRSRTAVAWIATVTAARALDRARIALADMTDK